MDIRTVTAVATLIAAFSCAPAGAQSTSATTAAPLAASAGAGSADESTRFCFHEGLRYSKGGIIQSPDKKNAWLICQHDPKTAVIVPAPPLMWVRQIR